MAALGLCCCAQAFSSCGEQGYSVAVCRLVIAVTSLVGEHGLQACGLQQLQYAGSVVVAHGLQRVDSVAVAHGLVAPRHVESSQTRARTRVPCIGRWILNHCATREIPAMLLIVENCEQPKLSTHSIWINKLWYIHTTYYIAISRNELKLCIAIRINLKIMKQIEKKRNLQSNTFSIIFIKFKSMQSYTICIMKVQIYAQE